MPLHVTRDDAGVVTLRLDNPARRNALDAEMAASLRAAVASLRTDDAVRCVVVTGTDGAFCSGADLGGLLEGGGSTVLQRREMLGAYYRTFLDVRELDVPTVAAVNGPAIGAGLNLALCCDLRVAAESSRFGATFVRLGIHPGGGGTHLLTRLIGPSRAAEMVLTGSVLSAGQALEWGLVGSVVPDAGLADAVGALTQRIAGNGPAAVRAAKRSLRLALDSSFEAMLEVESLAQAASQAAEDAAEGWAAFREKREPRFTGR
ncbi:MAG TPA: enoyl-CoA hydratase-related protein [Candidatus Dormibacteraeota bacterium]|jgi:enoyl-CoA hydratase|nr:enoyl-CoA hydratase-related protein [Candidatus Dormibacteraeota bacterium]